MQGCGCVEKPSASRAKGDRRNRQNPANSPAPAAYIECATPESAKGEIGVLKIAGVLAVLLVEAGFPLPGQTGAFQIVSIKPNRSGDGTSMRTSPGRFRAVSVTPHELLLYAFGVRDSQLIGGPDWLTKEKFDVEGVTGIAEDPDRTTLQPLLQTMFADRFQLKFHHEDRELPVYSLTVTKGGPKLTAHSGEGEPFTGIHSRSGKQVVNAQKVTMKRLAEVLGQQGDRLVIDNTGLEGEYDFKLSWTDLATVDSGEPALFTAIQEQLGLKLEAGKGRVQVTVIDSIGRPSEN
jgi:uncharacterized protein (TIGR03435 family)